MLTRPKALLSILAAAIAVTAGLSLCDSRETEFSVFEKPPGNADPDLSTNSRIDSHLQRQISESPQESFGGFYSAPAGIAFEYDLEAGFSTAAHRPNEPVAAGAGYEFAGRLRVSILDRRDGEILVGISFRQLQISPSFSGGEPEPGHAKTLAADLRRLTLMRMAPSGDVLGYRFAKNLEGDRRNWIRSLVSALRFVIREDAAIWERREPDATGIARVHYKWTTATDVQRILSKHKTDYLQLDDDLQDGLHEGSSVDGQGRAVMDSVIGWLREATYHEQMTVPLGAFGFTLRSSIHARCTLAETGRCTDDELKTASFDGGWDPLLGTTERGACIADWREQRHRMLLEGVSAEDLCLHLLALCQADLQNSHEMYETVRQLGWLVRLRPASLPHIKRLLLGYLTESAASAVLAGVGQAQTPVAESFLAGFVTDPSTSADLRLATLMAMSQLERPGSASRRAVDTLFRDETAPRALRGSALLLEGAFAERGEGILPSLLSREGEAKRTGMLRTWLDALGNAGGDGILPPVLRYLRHDDHAVRATAVSALRDIPGPAAVQALMDRALRDPSAEVRATAAEWLGPRATAQALSTLVHLLAKDPAEDVRESVMEAMATRREFDAMRSSLIHSAKHDPSPRLRARARRLLESRGRAG